MYCQAELRRLTEAYLAWSGESAASLGARVVDNRKWFKRLLTGHDVLASNAEIASDWFDQEWPGACPWPAGVPDGRSRQARRRKGWRSYR